jgi:hypothetical protein|nr:MAG TPA: hypothetical protein [Caudoviricetes sp.]
MRYEDEVRDEACSYLGREITDAEWNEALPPAQRKLDWIISREGDLDGERRKPYYLGKLVEERIRENAFSKWCNTMNELNQQRRMANETVPAHA